MGVHATYCLICGLPVQHDHYVPTERENLYAIYRRNNKPEGHFPFRPEHEWLRRGVAVSEDDEEPRFGSFEDGSLVGEDGEEGGYYAGRDYEDYGAMHTYCWEAAGKPKGYADFYFYRYGFLQTFLEKYQNQLFEFQECVDQGDGWLLQDPATPDGERNRRRIARILEMKQPPQEPVTTAEELLATDVWTHKYPGEGDFWRYRDNVPKAFDTSAFPELYWVCLEPAGTPKKELETFEKDLYSRLQGAGHAIALATLINQGKHFYCLYARHVEACDAVLAELCPVKGYEVNRAHDPKWESYYDELYKHIEYVPLW